MANLTNEKGEFAIAIFRHWPPSPKQLIPIITTLIGRGETLIDTYTTDHKVDLTSLFYSSSIILMLSSMLNDLTRTRGAAKSVLNVRHFCKLD